MEVIKVNGQRFNKKWLASVPISRAISVCTDTEPETVRLAWDKANGIVEAEKKPKTTRKK